MTTGYTVGIEDGTITTGKDFLKLCTRAFGIAIDLRDEPLSVPTPTEFVLDIYYKDRVDRARKELEHAKNMSFEDAKAKMMKSHAENVAMYKYLAEKDIENNKKYAKVKAEVKAWNPPTAEHYNIKRFALEQIDMCMTKQKWIDEYLQKANEKLDDSDEAVEKYITEQIECSYENVKRAENSLKEELERVASKNTWMEQFLNSL